MSYERIITHLSCEDEYLTFVIMLLCFKQTKKRSIKRINQYNINRMLTFGFPTWINTLLSIFTLSFLTRYDEILFVKRIINFPFNWLIPEFNIYHITVTGFLNKKKKKKNDTIHFVPSELKVNVRKFHLSCKRSIHLLFQARVSRKSRSSPVVETHLPK